VEAIFPSLVSEDKDGLKYLKTSIIGMMQLKSIQELADKNDALEAKNAELTQKLDRLMESNAALVAWAQTQGFS
jgi:cell shape-determining protein MreC